ncbi:MAG: hypothetical protein ABI557_19415, partial [Aureliella sp.]
LSPLCHLLSGIRLCLVVLIAALRKMRESLVFDGSFANVYSCGTIWQRIGKPDDADSRINQTLFNSICIHLRFFGKMTNDR